MAADSRYGLPNPDDEPDDESAIRGNSARANRIVVVSGAPGTGKSTIARTLADRIGCPAILRDEIKQGMVLAADKPSDTGHDELNYPALEVFFGRSSPDRELIAESQSVRAATRHGGS